MLCCVSLHLLTTQSIASVVALQAAGESCEYMIRLPGSVASQAAVFTQVLCGVQDSENDGWQKQGPVQSGVPRHWGSVRCGCIEGVLATAILAGQHPDVWDAAGLLLREHHKYDHLGQSTVTLGKTCESGLPGT